MNGQKAPVWVGVVIVALPFIAAFATRPGPEDFSTGPDYKPRRDYVEPVVTDRLSASVRRGSFSAVGGGSGSGTGSEASKIVGGASGPSTSSLMLNDGIPNPLKGMESNYDKDFEVSLVGPPDYVKVTDAVPVVYRTLLAMADAVETTVLLDGYIPKKNVKKFQRWDTVDFAQLALIGVTNMGPIPRELWDSMAEEHGTPLTDEEFAEMAVELEECKARLVKSLGADFKVDIIDDGKLLYRTRNSTAELSIGREKAETAAGSWEGVIYTVNTTLYFRDGHLYSLINMSEDRDEAIRESLAWRRRFISAQDPNAKVEDKLPGYLDQFRKDAYR